VFRVEIESQASAFPIVRLVPMLSGSERAAGRTGKLREHHELLTALRVLCATRCRLAGHAGAPLASLDGWRLAVQVPAGDCSTVCTGLRALVDGDEGPLRQYLSSAATGTR
jgi:hypothetical protein